MNRLAGGGGVMGLELAYGSSSGEEEEEEEPAQAKVAAPPAPAPAPAGASALPEGFFDDRTKDAIAHNRFCCLFVLPLNTNKHENCFHHCNW